MHRQFDAQLDQKILDGIKKKPPRPSGPLRLSRPSAPPRLHKPPIPPKNRIKVASILLIKLCTNLRECSYGIVNNIF